MYGFDTTVRGSMAEVTQRVTDALKAEGFGVLVTIDIDRALKEKLGVERAPYRILGACNPVLADQALQQEPNIGLLLPCNVVVREAGEGQMVVAFMDPAAVLGLVERPELRALGEEVKQRLVRACGSLTESR